MAAWSFILDGVTNLALALVPLFAAQPMPVSGPVLAIALGVRLIAGGGLLWTGILLERGERRGGWLALGFTVLPVLQLLVGAPLDWITILWTVLALLVLASIWDYLS
ncbi:MAG TPA: hypothetical protein VNL98_02370 [Gemmatimonadales bacterium]|nr:hypothetical protein [Gemmatimonadales bacterium]